MVVGRAEVAVVGAGIVGTCVVSALLSRGVPGPEIFWSDDDAGYEHRSATRYSGGLVRCGTATGARGDLAARAFATAWATSPDLVRCGALERFAPSDEDQVRERVERLRSLGVAAVVVPDGAVPPAAVGLPGLRLTGPMLWEPDAGYVDVHALRTALLRRAQDAGVQLSGEPVTHLTSEDGGVLVATAHSMVVASQVVVAAGSGTPDLLREWEGRVRTRRIGYAWFDGLVPPGTPTLDDPYREIWWRPAPTPRHPGRYLVGRAVRAASDGTCRPERWPGQEEHIRDGLAGLLDDPGAGTCSGGVTSFDVAPADGVPFDVSPTDSVPPWSTSHDGRVRSVTALDGGGAKIAPAIAQDLVADLVGALRHDLEEERC